MIRYKDKEFVQYSICPATGDIFDAKTGKVQETYLDRGRLIFKRMSIHQIMVHTFYGYKPGYDVHHLDENKLNNTLSNLVYLIHAEHTSLHKTELLHDETRVKMSASRKGKPHPHKGKPCSEETKANISSSLKGKPLSEETKQKISEAHKGKPLSEEHKAKLSAKLKGRESSMKGRHLSEETKMKLSLSLKGKPKTDKTKYKGHTPWNKDKKIGVRSEETRQKMSESAKEAWKKRSRSESSSL